MPLPQATHQLLRRFWSVHRNPVLLFPYRHGGLQGAAKAVSPLDAGGVQRALHSVVRSYGLIKKIAPYSLRHRDATHLIEAGGGFDRGAEVFRPSFDPHHHALDRIDALMDGLALAWGARR